MPPKGRSSKPSPSIINHPTIGCAQSEGGCSVPDWEKIAELGVDAGMVWVGDPGYSMTPDAPYAIASSWQGFVDQVFQRPFEQRGFALFEKTDDWGDVGVAVESGMGDG